MKQLALISSILLAVLASCTRPAPPIPLPETPLRDSLTAFDTLMQTCPDSALFALLDFNETHNDLTPFDRHYADLLISEALFKSDYEQTTRPALRQSLYYFDSLAAAYPKNDDCCLLSARSHYMNGVGLMEADSTVEACAEYLKALETVENHFDEKEIVGYKAKFMALTYNRLGQMFSDQFLVEQSIVCLKESLSIDKSDSPKYGLSKTLFYLGLQYDMSCKYDSAVYYYEEALEHLPDTDNLVYREIISSKALLDYLLNKKSEEPLCVLKHIKELASDEKEIITRSFTIGNIYFMDNQYDSAIVYLEEVFADTTDYLRRLETASCLNEIYDKKGDREKKEIYVRMLAKHTMDDFESKAFASRLHELFQQHQKQKQENRFAKKRHSILKRSFAIIGALTIIALLLVIILRCNFERNISSQKKEAETRQKEIQEKNRQIIERERISYQEEKKQLVNEIKELKESLKISQQKIKHTKGSNKAYEDFLNEPVCRSIIEKIQGIPITTRLNHNDFIQVNLDDKTVSEYLKTVSKHYEKFQPYLKSAYPNITQDDMLTCCLYLLGFEDKHIAFLRHKDYSSLNRRTNLLQKTFKTQRKFSEFIRKIAIDKYLEKDYLD